MKTFDIKDNHLLIYKDGVLIEDATENMNECHYCKHDPNTCGRIEAKYGGQFCGNLRILDEYKNISFEEKGDEKLKQSKKPKKFKGKYANYWKVNSLKGGY